MTATTTTPTIRRRPIRGAVYGLIAGLGVALILIDRAVIALGTLTPIVCVLVGGVLGLAWAWFGPARDGAPPPATERTDQASANADADGHGDTDPDDDET